MLFLLAFAAVAAAAVAQQHFLCPDTRKDNTVFDYAGTKVADPYNWLENADSDESKAWIEAENKLTFSYLHAIPEREKIVSKLKNLWNYERFTEPEQEGGRYFFSKNDGLQNQAVLYVSDSLNGEPRMLLDPNTLLKDGTMALNGMAISRDGKKIVYALSSGGSDWQEWHVRDVDTGQDTSDIIKWAKFSDANWTKDGKGFFYERFPEPTGNALKETVYNQTLYYHVLGTDQSADTVTYQRPDHKDWGFGTNVSDDGHYLIINAWQGTAHENRIFFKDLTNPDSKVQELFPNGDAAYVFLGNVGTTLYFQWDKGAPKGSIMSVDVASNDRKIKTVIPEAKEALEGMSLVGGKFFGRYLKDAHSEVRVYDLNGKLQHDVALPGIGASTGFAGRFDDKETFYSYASYTSPTTIYRYDIVSGESTVFRKPKVDFDGDAFETKEVFFKSKDGTRVPMFLTYKKGTKFDGSNPTLMYGYGGFDINETPYFSISRAIWLEMGGVYADVVLRGGAEYGEEWHKAGMLHNKQKVFDDFIAAGEYLIHERITSTPHLAIQGGSNGGLLIGAMITQRPDLWGATLPAVGVMDMLRFNKFTIGYAWMSEYGNPDTEGDFATIRKYSPLHNIKPGVKYPPALITTADHDDRVFPAHSFKFAATLQAAQAGNAPILIRIETRAGHGAGMPTSKIIEEIGDEWAFLVKNLNMTLPEGF
jgi:prolyl oligopeptidase